MSTGKWRAKATHCKNGHEYTPENIWNYTCPDGRVTRFCIACRVGRSQDANARVHRDPVTEANARILAYNAWLAGRQDDYVELERVE
jgi:hypothetical protein